MQYTFLGIAVLMILILMIACFVRFAPKIDNNSDIYGKDFVSIDDERGEK